VVGFDLLERPQFRSDPNDVLTLAGTLDGQNAHHQRLSSTPMAVVPDSGGEGLMTRQKGFVEMEEHGLLSYQGSTGFKRQSLCTGVWC